MAYEILAVKLCELEEQFSRLSSRIHLAETAGYKQLRQEMAALSRECAESELTMRKKLQLSRAEIVAPLASTYREVEQIIQRTKAELFEKAASRGGTDAASEEKILLAEYALDFAVQAANRALLLSMQAIDSQKSNEENGRRTT